MPTTDERLDAIEEQLEEIKHVLAGFYEIVGHVQEWLAAVAPLDQHTHEVVISKVEGQTRSELSRSNMRVPTPASQIQAVRRFLQPKLEGKLRPKRNGKKK